VYLAQRDFLYQTLASVDSNNAQGEFYLTDVAHLAAAAGRAGRALVVPETEVEGINDKVQLAEMERRTRQARNEELMRSGVTMLDPARVTVGFDCTVGRDVVLHPDVSLSGKTTVGEDTVISTGCVLTDAHLGSGVLLKPYSVLTNAVVGDECQVGPFAHLRPGTRLGTKAKIGNFVETKKAVFGQGSKASHLSYLGDCVLGRDVNIGAGTITCNYDGLDKHKTIIGDRVFIGSNSSIVAPCNIGEEALVAAGTTVTVDTIKPGALVLNEGRRQVEKAEWSFKVGPWARRRRRDANKKA
jgi:bifunctional UDP-N-acetylglucosamine pyrophosphorylase / glucosamine-1-phosphate N-acetyltransferase